MPSPIQFVHVNVRTPCTQATATTRRQAEGGSTNFSQQLAGVLLLAVASIPALCAAPAETQETQPATAPATIPATAPATAPAIEAPALTLLPPPDPAESEPPETPGFVPHTEADIDLTLREARFEQADILPYSTVSLVYPFWKKAADNLRQRVGLDLGLEQDLVYQGASRGPGVRDAGGGSVALFGRWRLVGTPDGLNNGNLLFKADYDWQIGSTTPSELGQNIGSLWRTSSGFGETRPCVSQFAWEQHLFDKALLVTVGKIDPTAFYAVNIWQNDKQFFMNEAFSGIPAVGVPGNGLGINAWWTPAPWLYLTAGCQNQQGSNTSAGFNTFGDFDLFSAAEIGITPDIPSLGHGDYRLTCWHADAVPTRSSPSDEGFALSFDQAVTRHVIPFFRYEYAHGPVTDIRQLATGGIGWQGPLLSRLDVCGLALAWGQPWQNDRDQWTAETFYRVQLSPANQLSIGYQAILHPSLSSEDAVGIFWVRFRILF